MIETPLQAVNAIAEIRALSGWKLSRIAVKAGVSPSTLTRMIKGDTGQAHQATYDSLDTLLNRLREAK